MRITAVSAGLGTPSSTRLLADQLAAAAEANLRGAGQQVELDVVELRPLAHPLADHLLTGFAPPELAEAMERVGGADALIVVTPVFAASYSGLFKTFFDVVDRDLLAGKPVQVAATAGSARHSLVLDHALRPLFSHLRALVLPTGVFAASEDFGSTADGQLAERVERAGRELAEHLLGGGGRPRPRDEFADPTPFEELLGQVG